MSSDTAVLPLSNRIAELEKRYYAALGACDYIDTIFHFTDVRALLEVSMEGRQTLQQIAKALREAYRFDEETDEWYWKPEWRDL